MYAAIKFIIAVFSFAVSIACLLDLAGVMEVSQIWWWLMYASVILISAFSAFDLYQKHKEKADPDP